jgi:predicted phage-related endonuclease
MLVVEDEKPLSKWGGPHKLWRIKTGREESNIKGPWLDRGLALEPWLLNRLAEKLDAKLKRSPGTRQHPKFPRMVDSVDALVWVNDNKKPDACAEAKAPLVYTLGEWGEENTDEMPKPYVLQGQMHMGVWDLPKCYYPIDAVGDIRVYETEHDQELWECLCMIVEKFWRDHVEPDIPPPVDGHIETSQWLSKRLKQHNQDIIDADEETVKKILEYREIRLRYDADEDKLDELANEIKMAIGGHKGICLPDNPKARITFGETKGRKRFDHDAFIQRLVQLLPDDVAPPDRNEFMVQGAAYRTFRPSNLLKHGG